MLFLSAKLNGETVQQQSFEFSCHLSLPIVLHHCSFTIFNLFLYQKALNPVIRCASPNFPFNSLGKAEKTAVSYVVGNKPSLSADSVEVCSQFET